MVDLPGSQLGPVQVPRRERQTVCEKRCQHFEMFREDLRTVHAYLCHHCTDSG
jgi:hypothetical protein